MTRRGFPSNIVLIEGRSPMSTQGSGGISMEEFRLMADRAGLGLTQTELEELKPLYELYLPHIEKLHSVDLGAEEISLSFEADWPS